MATTNESNSCMYLASKPFHWNLDFTQQRRVHGNGQATQILPPPLLWPSPLLPPHPLNLSALAKQLLLAPHSHQYGHYSSDDGYCDANLPTVIVELEERFRVKEELRYDEVRSSVHLLLQMLDVFVVASTVWVTMGVALGGREGGREGMNNGQYP